MRVASTGVARVCAGNAMEWFDSNIYATFAVFFAGQFFNDPPGGSSAGASSTGAASSVLASFAVFAVGFAARPIGGVLFGWWADRGRRRAAMLGSIALVAVASLAIGLTSSAASIGLAAPVVLVVARLVQGLGAGGELPAAQTYLAEIAPRRQRGLWGSLIYASGTLGVLIGTLMAAVLTSMLIPAQMTGFGWRVPFLLGGLAGIYVLVLRARLPETEEFQHAHHNYQPGSVHPSGSAAAIWRRVLSRPGLLVRVVGLGAGMTVPYYVWGVAAPSFAVTDRHTTPSTALWTATAATVVSVVSLPAWGAMSDRVGRRPVLLIPRLLIPLLLIPLDLLVQGQGWQLFTAMTVALVLISASTAVNPAVMAELLPTGIRATSLGLPNAIAVALFGGTAPYLHAYATHTHHPGVFTGYAITLCLVSLATVLTLPETNGYDLATTPPAPRTPAPAATPSHLTDRDQP